MILIRNCPLNKNINSYLLLSFELRGLNAIISSIVLYLKLNTIRFCERKLNLLKQSSHSNCSSISETPGKFFYSSSAYFFRAQMQLFLRFPCNRSIRNIWLIYICLWKLIMLTSPNDLNNLDLNDGFIKRENASHLTLIFEVSSLLDKKLFFSH